MDRILKNKKKRTKKLLLALFFVSIFLINGVSHSMAADQTTTNTPPAGTQTTSLAPPQIPPAQAPSQEGAKSIVSEVFVKSIKWVLYQTLQAVGWLFGIVGTIFQWAVDPANISGDGGLLNKQAVKDVWIMVRDTLNMTFIMVLLFAAFGTVFQLDSWNLNKVWFKILINALLVNFSYPIARVFIDISNVAMYFFLNHLFGGTGAGNGSAIMASFGNAASLSSVLLPGDYADADIAYLLAAIVFTFILGITLLVLAFLFVVRLIALTMIVMFSPIGFVGNIFPGKGNYAGQWWDSLFKYSFFGPVMVFMMMVSLQIMRAMGGDNFNTFKAAAQPNAPVDQANWIASASFYFIPIMILWFAMGISQKFGIAMSKEIVGKGEKFANWAGKSLWTSTHIPGIYKTVSDDFSKKGKLFGKKIPLMGNEDREARQARWAAGITGGYKKGYRKTSNEQFEKKNKEDIKNKSEGHDKSTNAALHGLVMDANLDEENRDKAIENAAAAKAAIARGAAYERVVEEHVKSGIDYVEIDARYENDKRTQETAHAAAMAAIIMPDINTYGRSQREQTRYQTDHAERLEEKRQLKQAHDKKLEGLRKEKERQEKDHVTEKKAEHMNKVRGIIKTGEEHGTKK